MLTLLASKEFILLINKGPVSVRFCYYNERPQTGSFDREEVCLVHICGGLEAWGQPQFGAREDLMAGGMTTCMRDTHIRAHGQTGSQRLGNGQNEPSITALSAPGTQESHLNPF